MFKKIKLLSVCCVLFLLAIPLDVAAFDDSYIKQELDLQSLYNTLSEEQLDYFPDTSINEQDLLNTANSFNISFIWRLFLNIFNPLIAPTLKTLSSLICTVIIISLINTINTSIGKPTFSKAVKYVSQIVLSVIFYELLSGVWASVQIYIKSINVFISSLVPIMTVLYTSGGNVSTAVVNSIGITFILNLINMLMNSGLFPMLKICFALTLSSVAGEIKGLFHLTKVIKNIMTFFLAGTMTLFSVFLIFKTNLSLATDSAAARTVKFAGSFIPVVGGALGESVRSVMSALSVIKNSVGIVGILIISVISLPVILKIILNKFCIDITGTICYILDCDAEGNLLKEFSSIFNFALAIIVCITVLFIIELTVFVSISPALGV